MNLPEPDWDRQYERYLEVCAPVPQKWTCEHCKREFYGKAPYLHEGLNACSVGCASELERADIEAEVPGSLLVVAVVVLVHVLTWGAR